MKKLIFLIVFLLGGCAVNNVQKPDDIGTVVPVEDLSWIAHKVFINETSGDYDKLVFWSPREEFLSLGIAHFIWYPEGQGGRFTETFPALMDYYKAVNEPLPEWLATRSERGAPWQYREDYLRDQYSDNVRKLRDLMGRTMNLQANFMAQRLRKALPEISSHVNDYDRERVIARYKAIEQTEKGLYPLLDYVNFKGEGTATTERYQGVGWGLLQVLQEMPDVSSGSQALEEFANAAETVLERRVRNSPASRNEHRWLAGWKHRIDSYRPNQLWR